jgi:hypothetical protein
MAQKALQILVVFGDEDERLHRDSDLSVDV